MPKSKQSNASIPKIINKRNRYFTGKYMTAADFADEQAYFLNRHWLHNRLHHGWGIVTGLRVLRHPDSACAHEWVVVRAGIAIDCYGRELILEKDTPFQMPKGIDDGVLVLYYREELIDNGPVLYSEEDCSSDRTEANRICEVAELKVMSLSEISADCWPQPDNEDHRCRDDCDDPLPGPGGALLTPKCRCKDGVVPLARLTFTYEAPYTHEKPGPIHIDMLGRRRLPPAPEYLTHIVDISWPHGGDVSVVDLQKCDGRLTVDFDRKLLVSPGSERGVNEYTFTVQYWGVQQSSEYLPGTVTLEADNSRAVFTIEPSFLKNMKKLTYDNIQITLKCDFILDCHGEPVDGEHLYGTLPSGNGRPGGTFESWFRVMPDQ